MLGDGGGVGGFSGFGGGGEGRWVTDRGGGVGGGGEGCGEGAGEGGNGETAAANKVGRDTLPYNQRGPVV